MRVDTDLQFLQYCDNEELRTLCDILTFDNNGKIRFCESLSKSDNYRSCYPRNMVGMWKDLACELQCYGGNTLSNLFRNGQGPAYEQIVYDVCKRMRIKDIRKYDSAEDMEQKLLLAVASKAIDELSEDDIRTIMNECHIHGYDYTKAGLLALLVAMREFNHRVFVIVVHTIMRMIGEVLLVRGVMIAGTGIMTRGAVLLCGPLGWLILGGWTAWDIMGPAYRVTIPAVIQVAYMRLKYQAKLKTNSACA